MLSNYINQFSKFDECSFSFYLMRLRRPGARGVQRLGQWAFNLLYEIRPDLAGMVRGQMDLDPYYEDDNMTRFLGWAETNWDG